MSNTNKYNIQVLERALYVLELLSDGNRRRLSEISDQMQISTSSTYRLLRTLANKGYVKRDKDNGGYRLGIRCLELARGYYETDDIRKLALPTLEWLRDETGETIHLGILDKMEVVYLEKLHGLHAIGLMSSRLGGRSPSHCTGLGKAMVAFLHEEEVHQYFKERGLRKYTDATITELGAFQLELQNIRENGYALDRGEHEHEVRCVAAPIFNDRNQIQAAVSVSGPANRMELEESLEHIIEKTRIAAGRIAELVGNRSMTSANPFPFVE